MMSHNALNVRTFDLRRSGSRHKDEIPSARGLGRKLSVSGQDYTPCPVAHRSLSDFFAGGYADPTDSEPVFHIIGDEHRTCKVFSPRIETAKFIILIDSHSFPQNKTLSFKAPQEAEIFRIPAGFLRKKVRRADEDSISGRLVSQSFPAFRAASG